MNDTHRAEFKADVQAMLEKTKAFYAEVWRYDVVDVLRAMQEVALGFATSVDAEIERVERLRALAGGSAGSSTGSSRTPAPPAAPAAAQHQNGYTGSSSGDELSFGTRPLTAPSYSGGAQPLVANTSNPALLSQKQMNAILAIWQSKGFSRGMLEQELLTRHGKKLDELTSREASTFIDSLRTVPEANHGGA